MKLHQAGENGSPRRAVRGLVEGLDPLEGWDSATVARDALVVVVAARHPWARRRALAPADLRSDRYLTRERYAGTREVGEVALAAAGVRLEPAVEATSFHTLKRAVGDGGFTIMSELAIAAECRDGTLVGLPVRGVDLARDLRAVRRHRTPPAGAARDFWRWLIARTPT